jgi:hypothetical protein
MYSKSPQWQETSLRRAGTKTAHSILCTGTSLDYESTGEIADLNFDNAKLEKERERRIPSPQRPGDVSPRKELEVSAPIPDASVGAKQLKKVRALMKTKKVRLKLKKAGTKVGNADVAAAPAVPAAAAASAAADTVACCVDVPKPTLLLPNLDPMSLATLGTLPVEASPQSEGKGVNNFAIKRGSNLDLAGAH